MSTQTRTTERIAIKQNDAYAIPWTLTDREGDPLDLSTADEVRFVMADAVGGSLYVNQPATIEYAPAGEVSYTFTTAETGETGLYVAEFHVIDGANQRTIPAGPDEYIGVDVTQGIARTLQAADLDPQNAAVAVLDAQTVNTDTAIIQNAPTQANHALRQGDIGTPAFSHDHTDDDLMPASVGGAPFAYPGELQAMLDAAAATVDASAGERIAVRMDSSQTYNPGQQITVPKGVSLYCNNAPLRITGDHGGFFVDTRANLFEANVRIDATATLSTSSTAIELDTGRATGGTKYGTQSSTSAIVTGRAKNEGSGVEGTGFAARTTAASGGNAVGIGTKVHVLVDGFDVGVHAQTDAAAASGGWINSGIWFTDIVACGTSVLHSGGGPFNTRLKGVIQTSSDTVHHFHNTGEDNSSATWEGKIWDWPLTTSTEFLNGDGFVIQADQLSGLRDQVAADSESVGFEYNAAAGWSMYNFADEQRYQFNPTADGLQVQLSPGGVPFTWNKSGAIDIAAVDVANYIPPKPGVVRVHNGANTGGRRELAVSLGNNDWLLQAQNITVTPS